MRQVDKERVKQFINLTKEDAEEASSLGSGSRYSFDIFCKRNNLYQKGVKYQSGGTVIHCPFHTDFDPSCSLNDSKGWKCFSCGRGGNYWSFVHLYRTEILGENISIYQVMQEALNEDASLTSRLGFKSLYTTAKKFPDEIEIPKKKRFVFKGDQPRTYLELQTKMLRSGISRGQIKKMILLMQSGVSVENAYKELQISHESKKQYDLSQLGVFR